MINGGFLFIGFMMVWIVFGVAKDYERQSRIKREEEQQEDSTQTKNKKVGKRNV